MSVPDYSAQYLQARRNGNMPVAIAWRRAEWDDKYLRARAEQEERAWWAANHKESKVPDENPKAAQASREGKLRLELLEQAADHPIATALASGADKYGVRNWRVNPIHIRTYVGALRRHIDAWEAGEDVDADSGLHPLAHVGATVHVVLDALAHGTLVDDRDFAEDKTAKPEPATGLRCPDNRACAMYGCSGDCR